MKLFVGLGNPGRAYAKTRHNIGFFVVDELAKSLNAEINQKKFKGLLCQVNIHNEKVILLKPQTYMNLSGECVVLVKNYYQIADEDVFLVYDDLDLPLGKLRLREKGTGGGHNGVKNIIQHLNTKEIKRIRIGIGCDKNIDQKDFVLGKFNKEEQKTLKESLALASSALQDSVKMNFVDVMSKYNHK